MLTASRLRSVLSYDPLTGVFVWIAKPHPATRNLVGQVAGTLATSGHRQIMIDGRAHEANRLAWLYMTGEWPTHFVDHRNTEPDDNRWENLREATAGINAENQRRAKVSNKSGYLGVYASRNGTFIAEIKADGRKRYLGAHTTAEAAHAAYLAAKRQLHAGNTL